MKLTCFFSLKLLVGGPPECWLPTCARPVGPKAALLDGLDSLARGLCN